MLSLAQAGERPAIVRTVATRDEGIVERWEKREDGFHLSTSGCPHKRAAQATHSLCTSEQRAIYLLLVDDIARTATVAELHALVDATLAQVADDLRAIDEGRVQPDRTGRQFLEGGDESDGAIVLHVLEEAYQHLGHMELAADALAIRG